MMIQSKPLLKFKGKIDMVMAVGLSQHNVALMHVVNHAFFIREPYESNFVQNNYTVCWNILKT